MPHRSLCLLLFAALWFCAVPTRADSPVLFNRDIRPILSDKCFRCHGPDARERKVGLRLDQAESATRALKSGKIAVVAGKPDASELVRRIHLADPDDRMPPASLGKTLSDGEKQLLARWILEGARWQKHWAYEPLERPSVPPVRDSAWPASDIDRFVLDSLEREGLRPSAEASRARLLRRASFDLTGLPPEPDAARSFEEDRRPGSWERAIERLIGSPAFGERMAQWWLDVARYADTVGYHGDQEQSVWPWRDWVIRSFNENLPFDRFTLAQIAGDLVPEATLEQRIASAYNRLAMKSAEGGVQDREYLAKYAAERVRAMSGAWLGATMGCCECHDHKYDPYSTRDFYRMASFWADNSERGIYGGAESSGAWGPTAQVPTEVQARRQMELAAAITETEGLLAAPMAELEADQVAWEGSLGRPADWEILKPVTIAADGTVKLDVLPDGSVLASGGSPEKTVYTVMVLMPSHSVTAFRIEALPHDSLPKKGPGRAGNGNFVLTGFEARWRPGAIADERPIALLNPSATFEQTSAAEKLPKKRWAVELALDPESGKKGFGWAVLDRVGEPHEAVFELSETLAPRSTGTLSFTLRQDHGAGSHTIGRFRLSTTATPLPVKVFGAGLPRAVVDAIATEAASRTDVQRKAIAAHYRGIAPRLDPHRKRLAELKGERDQLEKAIPRVLVTQRVEPRTMRVLARGNWMDDSGDVVVPGVPHFLPQPKVAGDRATRLDLARWITSNENPLTARVVANRVWKLFFGAGLSRRVDDLGSQGEWPSHPELLDWLACELRDSAWDLKHLVRTIVVSAAYRQDSAASPALAERDPFNRMLARQGRFRLDAESIRDGALVSSGLLTRRVGGPSVKPYQPPGHWAYLNFPMREWQNDAGESQYRRGLYTHWQRQYLHPSMSAFDAPSREECVADRIVSNTPLQALVLLNDPSYVEAARVLAEQLLRESGSSTEERLGWLFRRILTRACLVEEHAVLSALVQKHLDDFRRDGEAASKLLAVGQKARAADLDPAVLAAWTSAARAVMNLHETITRN